MAVLGINYDGGNYYNDNGEKVENNIIYESVYLYTTEKRYIFNSGNFVKDWFDANKLYLTELYKIEPHLSYSSSVNHFFFDGGDYDSGYLHEIKKGQFELLYVDKSDPHYLLTQRHIYEGGAEFFVESGTKPTWVELKELVK